MSLRRFFRHAAAFFTCCIAVQHAVTPATQYAYFLQPLLLFNNATPVLSPPQWVARRSEIAALLESAILGTRPPPPLLVSAEVLNVTQISGGATEIFVELTFSTPSGAIDFIIEIIVPRSEGPLPIFLTQWTHRGWSSIAVSRGYLAVVYPASDGHDVAPAFQIAFGHNNTSMGLIHARAFVASRVLDYVLGPHFGNGFPAPVPLINASAVCISGHSRNGKQSVIAAAFDERISAVVGSSPGAPVSTPWQYGTPNFYGEPPSASLPSAWWIPSTAQYDYHPEDLPMDGHGVLALVSPRALAISTAWTDREGDHTAGTEAGVRAARDVYALLGAGEQSLTILHRPGDHHGYVDVHTYFDFFDHHFGRLSAGFPMGYSPDFSLSFLTNVGGFNYSLWNASFGAAVPPPPPIAPLSERVSWLLQLNESASGGYYGSGTSYAEEGPANFRYPSVMMSSDFDVDENGVSSAVVRRASVSFGEYLTCNVYYPANATGALPAVVWLHPYSYATGFVSTYGQAQVIPALVNSGIVVLSFDQVGFGSRLRQGGTTFFARHGASASPFGHMVRDVRASMDFLICTSVNASSCWAGADTGLYPDALKAIPRVDASRIFLAGYSLGGNVALHAAALDPRVAGVAAISAFTPFRSDNITKATGGLRRLYEIHGVLPRLGLFLQETSVPYDYDELIAALAPRPVLLVSAELDRDATLSDVVACVSAARRAWTNPTLLNHTVTSGGTRMGEYEASLLASWVSKRP
jgi:hypothetical protein